MRIRTTLPASAVSEDTLGAFLDLATDAAQHDVEQGAVPPLSDAIEQGMVKWKPEDSAPGDESFDRPRDVFERGHGDCDDLGPWWAAELRASDEDPEARAIAYQSGPTRWHVVVQRGDGSVDDPSRWAGMGRALDGREGRRPAIVEPMADTEHAVVGFHRSRSGLWTARMDVPIDDSLYEDPETLDLWGLDGVCGVSVERTGTNQFDALAQVCAMLGLYSLYGAPDDVLEKLAYVSAILRGEADVEGCRTMGEFVEGVARTIAKVSVSPNALSQAGNIAATIFDPLGLRNLLIPAAQAVTRGGTVTANISGAPTPRRRRASTGSAQARRQQLLQQRQQQQQQQPYYGDGYGDGYGDQGDGGGVDLAAMYAQDYGYGVQQGSGYGYSPSQWQQGSYDPSAYYRAYYGAQGYQQQPGYGAGYYGGMYGQQPYGYGSSYYGSGGLTPVY